MSTGQACFQIQVCHLVARKSHEESKQDELETLFIYKKKNLNCNFD